MKKKVIGLLVVIGLVLVDLISKQVVTSTINYQEQVPVIDGFFWLTNVRNTGAAWSLFDGQLPLLTLISFVAAILLTGYYIKHRQMSHLENICMILIIAGTIGNLYDRFFFSYVRDFLSFNIFGYMFPVFNIADSCLVIGVFGMLIYTFIEEKNHDKN